MGAGAPPITISILGVTGSIGRSTMAVVEAQRAAGREIAVAAIAAGGDVAEVTAAAVRMQPRYVALADPGKAQALRASLAAAGVKAGSGAGSEAVMEAGALPADWVMSAIVGAAGLAPTLAALRQGRRVAIANKESLVCAGPLMMAQARAHGAQVLPVDSEHNAIFQVLQQRAAVAAVTLTASGGPFRTWTRAQMGQVSPEQACAHPNWAMGPKNSIDSATLVNKGLELIEAAYLFDLAEPEIEVLVHPQSIVHCLVRYCDGSVLAQMAAPDMRIPIGVALNWPERAALPVPALDLAALGALTFEAPDHDRFPGLKLAREALRAGGGAPAGFNAANEMAVAAFIAGRIGFLDIASIIAEVLSSGAGAEIISVSPSSLDEVLAVDAAARRAAGMAVQRRVG